jgi:hypothetical protein
MGGQRVILHTAFQTKHITDEQDYMSAAAIGGKGRANHYVLGAVFRKRLGDLTDIARIGAVKVEQC